MADCTERIIILTVQAVDVLEVSLVGSWGGAISLHFRDGTRAATAMHTAGNMYVTFSY